MVKKYIPPTLASLGVILLVINSFWLIYNTKHTTEQPKDNGSEYPYLSKRIFAESQNDILINFTPLRKQLEPKFKALGADTEVSFYFEYLPSGTSIRFGDNNELIAASLIKVPLVMNLYKAAELGKINLDQTIKITNEELDDAYGDLWKKGAGTQISLREAARLTLEQSDNTASHVIFDHMKGLLEENDQSLARLDVDQNLKNGQAVINAKSYSSVLKSLYFASYVNRQNSQEILNYLTHSTETNRLTKHIPKSTPVAHKNGVYNAQWAESDCGIVYLPKRPYLVCAMVGLPEEQSNQFIADVSKTIYDYVTNYH